MSADILYETKSGERWVIKFQQYISTCLAKAYKLPSQGTFTFNTASVECEAPSLAAAREGVIARIETQSSP